MSQKQAVFQNPVGPVYTLSPEDSFCKTFHQSLLSLFRCPLLRFFSFFFLQLSKKRKSSNTISTSSQPLEQILQSFLTILLVLKRWTSLTIPLELMQSGYGLRLMLNFIVSLNSLFTPYSTLFLVPIRHVH